MDNTQYYGLKKWDASDRVLREDFNSNNDKVDAAIAAAKEAAQNAQSAAGSAQSAAAGLQTTLNQQAASITALQTALTKRGNCKIETGTYTGEGTHSKWKTLTFSAKPELVVIMGQGIGDCFMAAYNCAVASVQGSSNYSSASVTWSGNSMSRTGKDAAAEMDLSGETYVYLAFSML